jgi:nicotinate-nucleotide adenylyltransferase
LPTPRPAATPESPEPAEPREAPGTPDPPGTPERIGLFGGTFDPPHLGHVAALRAISTALSLDRLLLVVANDPWQKSSSRAVTPAEDRFAMAQALAEGIPGVEASRMEIDRGGPSYTVTTVESLRAEAQASGRPLPQIYLIVGADLLPELGTWERADDLAKMVTLAVVSRPPTATATATGTAIETGAATATGAGHPRTAPPGWRLEWIDGPLVDVSSSAVRDVLERGGPVDELVPAAVMHCIRRRDLYAGHR